MRDEATCDTFAGSIQTAMLKPSYAGPEVRRMVVDTDVVVDALCRVGRPIILRYASPDSCIASCRIGMDVLRMFGIRSHPIAVKAAVFNQKGHEFMDSGHPDWVRQGRDGAHSVGIGYGGPDPRKWDGHLVLLVRGRLLLDLSIDQAARPDKGIYLHAFRTVLPTGFLEQGSGLVVQNPEGGTISYELNLGNRSWKFAPDWREGRWDDVTHLVTVAVRQRLKEMAVKPLQTKVVK